MTHIIIQSKDGKQIDLTMFNFANGLAFAKSYNKRRYDSATKVWHIAYNADVIESDIVYQLAENSIHSFLIDCNDKYGHNVAFSLTDNSAALGMRDLEYWTKQLLSNPDTLHEIELDILSQVDDHVYNYR